MHASRGVLRGFGGRAQDVPRTVDHAASRTFYTWRVDGAAVSKRVGEELLQAAANLRARLLHELTAHAEVFPLLHILSCGQQPSMILHCHKLC